MSLLLSVLLAFIFDFLFKEPRKFHPLVGFGNIAIAIEKCLNVPGKGRLAERLSGVLAWSLAVLPWVLLGWLLESVLHDLIWQITVAGLVLYLSVGWQSLLQHAAAIAAPLAQGDLDAAREAVAMIVSRDTAQLDETAIATAATESVLENGADAIFSALFWFCLLGIPGVILYRLSNTLDAMWGYKNMRFLHFGWCAARIDDLLNFIPARLTALSYALAGHTQIAIQVWRQQALTWKSPNAGPVMAAGAGALNTALGGAAVYHGQPQQRPPLGPSDGEKASATTIYSACALLNRALLLWLGVLALGAAVVYLLTAYCL